jgi:hypothetical protein
MPSVGRIQQLSVAALAAAFLGVAASSASAANPIWLWACHDPNGGALTKLGAYAGPTNASKSCTQNDPSFGAYDDGLRTSLATGSESSWRFSVPPSVSLQELAVYRKTTELGAGQRYELKADSVVLETRSAGQAPLSGGASFTPKAPSTELGRSVSFGLSCTAPCSQPAGTTAGADAFAIGMKVVDRTKPNFAVGGTRSPLTGTMDIDVQATDTGSGLRSATATLGSVTDSAPFAGNDDCRDLTPATQSVDMSINADCAEVGSVDLSLATRNVIPDDDYTLTVTVTDWAGNVRSSSQPIKVLNTLPVNTPTQTLSIGTSGIVQQEAPNNPGAGSDVRGASSRQCRSPRLSVYLAQKPLRVRRGQPVLKVGKRYRFRGRLTCVINNRRRSAPKRTRIDILNTVRRNKRNRTVKKAGTRIRDKGRLSVILSYRSSRLITFRFTNSDGQRSQVRIRIRVAKR